MKKSILNRVQIVFALLVVLVFSGMSFALSGNGTESSPYLISSAADLKAFAEKVNHEDKEVAEVAAWAKLTADIDLNPGKTILNSDGTLYNNGADLEQWVRIGAYTTRHYAGTFDGQGHTISGVYINASSLDYVGLFGFIGEGGLVKNFGVKNSYICGRAFVGGIVAVNNGTVRDVHYEGTLIGTESNVGGVAGTNAGAISNVYKTGLVKHGNFGDWASSIGGVVGYNLGTVTGSYNTGDVIVSSYSESGQNVGGVVGANSGTVSDVYNTGSVSVKNTLSGYGGQNIGGVVGKNKVGDNKGSGVVNGAYNAGTVSGANIVGGVVGLNEKSAEVRNVYNIGAVDGGWRPVSMLVTFVIGGLIGYNYGYATLAYNNGVVTSSGYYGNDGAVGAGNNVSFGYYNMEECPDCQANGSYGLETLDLASLDVAKLFPGSEKTWIPGSVKQISLTEYKIQLPGILNLGVQPEMVYKFEPNADGVYEIKSAQQLRLFAKLVNSGKNSIKGKLVRDIVLNSEVYFLEVPQWDPIGTYGHPFIGSFDGDGHTIEGLYFDNVNQNYVGLFGYVGSNGEVKKVSLKNSHIKGNVCVGGIAGTSNGAITGVSNASGVSGVEDVGGIVGCNDGLVRDVHNTGSVNGGDEIGGVVGLNDAEGEVSDASNAGVMQGGQDVGGVVGTNRGSVSKAYNARTVHGTNATGGVIGGNEGSVNSVYNEGTLNGDKGVTGGVVGINDGGSISDAFNTGAVEKAVYSTSWVGGVVGSLISGSVKNVYNTGLVSDNFAVNEVPVAGVVVGRNVSGTIENAYYNTDLACSDCNTSFGTGKTTVELASKTLLTGFSSSIWGVGSGEPVFEEEKLVYKLIYLKGVGTQPKLEYAGFLPNASGVYEISTAKELFLFAEIVNKSKKAVNGKLTRDIVLNKDVLKADGSLSGNYASFTKWTPIGTKNNPFIGQFDGDGNAVYGLYFSDVNKDTVGLFGYVGINGKVMNVGVKDSYIEGGDYVGGVVGFNDGSVSKVYNEGTMKGGSYVGGVVGAGSVSEAYNTGLVNGTGGNVGGVAGRNSGTINDVYNTGAVSGTGGNVGGVAGRNSGTINDVYNTGSVRGTNNVGGVAGYNYGAINDVYNTGAVSGTGDYVGRVIGYKSSGSVTKAYYNSDIACSSCNNSIGTGKTTWGLATATLTVLFSTTDAWVAGAVKSDLGNGKLSVLLPGLKNLGFQPEMKCDGFLPNANGVYEISSVQKLKWFAELVNGGSVSVKGKLTTNINLNEGKTVLDANGALYNNGDGLESWIPIGTYENPFTGTFDGNGYAISGLFVNSTSESYVGLFGVVGSKGEVKNVGVKDSYFNGRNYVGSIVGYNRGVINRVYNTGVVKGIWSVGGVIGYNGKATLNDVYNTGIVSGTDGCVGGIVGDNYGSISNVYNSGLVSGTGGNVGRVAGYVSASGSVENAYYNKNVSCSLCNNFTGTGKTTWELATATLTELFSSADVWVAGSVKSALSNGNTVLLLPGLRNVGTQPEMEVEGLKPNADGVYEISNAEQLLWFANFVNAVDGYYIKAKLTANIVLNENVLKVDGSLNDDFAGFVQWTPIGTCLNGFAGEFDGQGFTISGLYFDDANRDTVGLFGLNKGEVINVGVENSYIKGRKFVGGVAGYNRGVINRVYNTGVVKGIWSVGGVIGYNGKATLNDVYNTGIVSGTDGCVGGIVGDNYGSISNVYNSGLVSGTGGNVGRVIGYKSSGSVTNAYYNSDIACSSCNNSIGTGKTAVELANTILPNGFSSEVWGVGSGQLVVSNGKLVYKLPYLLNVGNQHEFAVLQPNAEGVFEISSAQELTWFAKLVNSGETSIKGKLTQNIVVNQNVLNANGSLNTGNLSNFSIWTPIGTQNQPFNGSFDGAGYTISGLYVLGDDYAGLFGYVGSSGKVEKVGVEKSYVSGKYYVGSIVGYNNGAVRNVYNTSVVSESSDYVGGVAGYVSASGSVENAYSTGSVSGTGDYIGGAIGKNDGSVSNVYYSTDVVSSSASIEGVTGLTSAKLASKTLPEGFSSDIWVPGSGEPVVSNGKKVYKLPGFVASGTQPEIGWVFGPNADGIYEISSANELSKFAKIVNGGQTSVKGKLTANIVVNKNVLKADGSLSGNSANFTQWTPIGTSENPFVGTFDGAGYTVSGLYINEAKANYVGLFGSVGSKGSVMNVGVEDSYFMGEKLVGGVVGYNTGSVSKVYNTGSVNGTELVGGVVGLNIAEISDVYNTGSVEGAISIGGVAGGSDGSIVNAYNTGSVAGSNEVGGVAGYNAGNISNSFFNKEVYTGNAVGSGNAGTNVLSKTTAELASKTLPEGFSSSIWVAGSGEQPVLSNGKLVYKLWGLNKVGSQPEIEYTGFQPNSDGVYVISSAQQLNMFAQLVNGGNVSINGKLTADIVLNENVLKADGSLSDDFANFTQWTPIGISANQFIGTFDGNGRTIRGLYINGSNGGVGLFGNVGEGGKVMNVGLEDSYIKGGSVVGGVVARNCGEVNNVYNTGSVNGGLYVGGVLGVNNGSVSNVYNMGTVTGTRGHIGGVVGDNIGSVSATYNSGVVVWNSSSVPLASREGLVGSVVGNNEGTITASYYNTDVACTNCTESFGKPVTTATLASKILPMGFNSAIWLAGSGPFESNGKQMCKLPGLRNVGSQPETEYIGSSFGENGVYEISSAEELLKFAEIVNNGDASITGTLVADIVLNKNVLNANGTLSSDSASFTQWTPIGTAANPFTGTFGGNGHIISGLYFNDESKDSVGLFGYVGANGKVTNVGVEDSYILGKSYVGGVVGFCIDGFVSGVYNAGIVRGLGSNVGGVVGKFSITSRAGRVIDRNATDLYAISNVYNTGSVLGSDVVGGVVGNITVNVPGRQSTVGSLGGTQTITNAFAVINAYNTGAANATRGDADRIVGKINTIYEGKQSLTPPTLHINKLYYNKGVACAECSNIYGLGKTSAELALLNLDTAFTNSTDIWSAGSIDNSGDHITYNYPRLTVFGDRSQPKSSPAVVIAADGGSATIYGAATDAVNITSDIEVTGPVSFKREFPNLATASSFSSIMLPFEPNSKPEGVSFYSFSRVSKADGKWGVYVKNVSSLEANTPYLVKVVSGTTSIDFADGGTFKATAGEHVTTEGSWNLVGAYEYKQWLEGDPSIGKSYAFAGSKDNDPSIVGKFSKIAAGAYIYPMRAYLEYRAPAAAGRPAAPGEKAPQSVSASLPENMDVWVIEDSENGEETTRVIGSFNTRTGEFKAAPERYYDMKGRHLGNKKPNVRGIYNNGKKVFVK